ncbi:MAG: Colistin resistance protein EmrB [Candidatus Celerinatantimonas neptuna]|nr:MAG: Colistin resistance protein EmrB [Candidatus Celerinatantimonas neptuna]
MTQMVISSPAVQSVTRAQWLAIFGGLLGGFMAILDIQVTNASMKVIQGALSATLNDSSWLMTSYFTAEIVAIPLCGWLTKAFGTGRYALWCIGLFMIASLLCSMSWSLDSMIIFRSLQGFSGGALIPISFRLIIELLPPKKRPIGMAMFSVVATFAPAIGPALGGFLTANFSWHAIFYINLIPGMIALFLISQGIPKESARWSIIRNGDFLGVVFVTLFLGTLEVILERGGDDGWLKSNLICWLSVISIISFIMFLYDQVKYPYPLINLNLFRDYLFSYSLLMFSMLGTAIYGTLFLVPYYLTMVHNYNASQIGEVIIWMGFPQLFILPFIPKLINHINLKYMIFIGFLGLSISAFMDSHMSIHFAGEQMKWSLIVRALGQPFIMVPLSMISTLNIKKEDNASSAIIINVFRSLGGSFGTAILITFFITFIHLHVANIKDAMHPGTELFNHYIHQVHSLLQSDYYSPGSASLTDTSLSILYVRIKQQAEIMAFNDLFTIMGCMMFGAAILILFSDRNFKFYKSQAKGEQDE